MFTELKAAQKRFLSLLAVPSAEELAAAAPVGAVWCQRRRLRAMPHVSFSSWGSLYSATYRFHSSPPSRRHGAIGWSLSGQGARSWSRVRYSPRAMPCTSMCTRTYTRTPPNLQPSGRHTQLPTPQCSGGGICPGIPQPNGCTNRGISSAGAHHTQHPTPQCSGGGICPGTPQPWVHH